MRWIATFAFLLLAWYLFAGTPAEALPLPPSAPGPFFMIGTVSGVTNPGTISYAGGTAPLVGSNIDVDFITRDIAIAGSSDAELSCLQCTLSFSTGPFAGTIPSQFPGGPDDYSFSGGGALQILGGASFFDGTGIVSLLPIGTVLLSGVPITGGVGEGVLNFGTLVHVGFQGALHPQIEAFNQLPVDASVEGDARIGSVEEVSAPEAFTLSHVGSLGGFLSDPSHVETRSVPLPDMLWPTVIGMIGLAGFVAWRTRAEGRT